MVDTSNPTKRVSREYNGAFRICSNDSSNNTNTNNTIGGSGINTFSTDWRLSAGRVNTLYVERTLSVSKTLTNACFFFIVTNFWAWMMFLVVFRKAWPVFNPKFINS